MIDFSNSEIIKLGKSSEEPKDLKPLLVPGEEIIATYKSIRDYVSFTNKRVISVNVQGLLGKKRDYTSLPYSKIQAFSVETAGTFDSDCELDLTFSGLGTVRFELSASTDIIKIGQLIGNYVL